MELYEQIRREYEHGAGNVRAVARKLGVHRREVRRALANAMPPDRKRPLRERPKLAAGDTVYRRDSGGRSASSAQAASHGTSHLDAAAAGEAGDHCRRSPLCASYVRHEARRWGCFVTRSSCRSRTSLAARRRWTGTRCWPELGGERRRCTSSACAGWPRAREPFIGRIRTPPSRHFWKRTNWHSMVWRGLSHCAIRQSEQCSEEDPARASAGRDHAVHCLPFALGLHGGVLHAGRGPREGRRRGRRRPVPAQPSCPGADGARSGGTEPASGVRLLEEQNRDHRRPQPAIGAAMLAEREHLLPLARRIRSGRVAFSPVNQSGCVKVLTNSYSMPLPVGTDFEVRSTRPIESGTPDGAWHGMSAATNASRRCWSWSIIWTRWRRSREHWPVRPPWNSAAHKAAGRAVMTASGRWPRRRIGRQAATRTMIDVLLLERGREQRMCGKLWTSPGDGLLEPGRDPYLLTVERARKETLTEVDSRCAARYERPLPSMDAYEQLLPNYAVARRWSNEHRFSRSTATIQQRAGSSISPPWRPVREPGRRGGEEKAVAPSFLEALLSAETEEREQNAVRRRIKEAHFPTVKTLEEFDFPEAPHLPVQIRQLADGGYRPRNPSCLWEIQGREKLIWRLAWRWRHVGRENGCGLRRQRRWSMNWWKRGTTTN